MKKMLRYLTLSSILFAASVSTYSQAAFEVPDNIQLNTKEDYVQSEQQIVEAANWLEQTDVDKEADKRQKVNAFIKWVSGSPTVTINIVEPLSKIYGKNVQLLGIYLASYASYCIGHKGSIDESQAIQAGLVSMMNVYKKGIAVQKTKEMEKIIKMSDLDLKEYISKKLMAK